MSRNFRYRRLLSYPDSTRQLQCLMQWRELGDLQWRVLPECWVEACQ